MIGAFTQQIDLVEVLVVAFTLFFFALVFYLQRESKREGYPLEEEIATLPHAIVGFPDVPPPKTYKLLEGGTVTLPQEYARRELHVQPREHHSGAPLYPTDDAMRAGVGPGAYTLRRNTPFLLRDGTPAIKPMRLMHEHKLLDPDMDPRGRRVIGSDMAQAGVVVDFWYDDESKIVRYLEVELIGSTALRLVPIFYATIRRGTSYLRINCCTGAQVANAPVTRHPEQITAREEDVINGFYAAGPIYSAPFKDAVL